MIMLLSFIPVFMLSGREGKLFHPLAFTKSFAMIGVAIISVTLVPALIPDVHQRPAAQRGRKLDRPQLHQYLQAAADLGAATTQPGDVDVCGAAGAGRGHVSAAGGRRAGSVGDCLAKRVSSRVRRGHVADGRSYARLAVASSVVGEPRR